MELTDSDGDGLIDSRELELGTNIKIRDTYNLSAHADEYKDYADYADQELYCRWKQEGVEADDESKDWAFPGTQCCTH